MSKIYVVVVNEGSLFNHDDRGQTVKCCFTDKKRAQDYIKKESINLNTRSDYLEIFEVPLYE